MTKTFQISLKEIGSNDTYIVSNKQEVNPLEELSSAGVGFLNLYDGRNINTIGCEESDSKAIKNFFLENDFWFGEVRGEISKNGYLKLLPRNGIANDSRKLIGFVYAPKNSSIKNPKELLLIAIKRVEVFLNNEIFTLSYEDLSNPLLNGLVEVWYGKRNALNNIATMLENGGYKLGGSNANCA